MNGIIGIDHHKVECIVGVYPEEHMQAQTLYIDLAVEWDFLPASRNDQIAETLNYELLADLCTAVAKARRFHLLETLAVAILEAMFTQFDLRWGKIKIKKPGALPSANYTFVQLERCRS